MTLRSVFCAFGTGMALVITAALGDTEAEELSANRPRVLITNDNGIDDPKLVAHGTCIFSSVVKTGGLAANLALA